MAGLTKEKMRQRQTEERELDDVVIGAAEYRKHMRQIQQREVGPKEHGGDGDLQNTVFSSMLKSFQNARRTMGTAALLCPACGGLPDDPRLAPCAHVFCEECYSEMLVDAGPEATGTDGYLLCEASGCHANILGALTLDEEQWKALGAEQGPRPDGRYSQHGQGLVDNGPQSGQPDDLMDNPTLDITDSVQSSSPALERETNESDSDEASNVSMSDINHDSDREPSDDGFDRQSERSDGYLTGSECEFIDDESVCICGDCEDTNADDMSTCSAVNSEIVTFDEIVDLMDTDGDDYALATWADQWLRSDDEWSDDSMAEEPQCPWVED